MPEPPTIVAVLRVAVSPTDGLAVIVIVPLNPCREATVSVEVALWDTSTTAGEEAERVKSCTL